MRESKKSEGGAFKAPPPPDRIGLIMYNLSLLNTFKIVKIIQDLRNFARCDEALLIHLQLKSHLHSLSVIEIVVHMLDF